MTRVKEGDIFEIDTPKGKVYLHALCEGEKGGAYIVRVLQGFYPDPPANLDEVAAAPERYMVCFGLSVASYRKMVKKVGYYPVDKFEPPKYMRAPEIVRGEFLGWHIIERATWKMQLVKNLTPEQRQLSTASIWGYMYLVDRLVEGWSLEKWCAGMQAGQYVGIEDDLAKKAAIRLTESGFDIDGLIKGVPAADARAVEVTLSEIERLDGSGVTLEEEIRKITRKNPAKVAILERGYALLKSIGYGKG